MNVLVFSTDDHLHPAGGAESAMGEISKRMPDVQFDLVTARLRKTATKYQEVGNMRIHRIGFGIPRFDGYLLAIFGHRIALKLHKKHNFNLIWNMMASYGAFSSVRVKKKTGLPMLLTLQEGDDISYILNKVRFVRKQFNEIFESADGLQAISNFLLKWGEDMGFQGKIKKVIPNAVDVAAFTKEFTEAEILEQKKEFGFPSDATIVITSSRLEVKNGVGDVVDALALLPENVCFVICGGGSLEEEIKGKVNKHGLESRVKFMGYVPIETIPKMLHASDIFIRPSLTEGLGNSFLEAMSAELPTIGTPVGGIPDFLLDGETGFLCEPENPESIKETVTRILALSDEERTRITSQAKSDVLEKYNWEVVTKQMREMFESLAKN